MLGLSRTPGRAVIAVLTTSTMVVLTSACSLLNKETPPPPPIINDYVSAVQVLGDGGTSEIVNQQLGDGAADGPAVTVPEDTTVVNGGSVQEAIKSTTPFSKVRVGLEPLTSAASPSPGSSPAAAASPTVTPKGPARGYHEVTLAKPGTEIEIVLTITQSLPGDQFIFYFAVVDAGGKQGKLSKQKVDAIQVGTGQVQVSVQWDGDSDVDLHVMDPNGDEVYWDNTSVASGGQLDLDSNANCDLDHVRNENITWSKAPPASTSCAWTTSSAATSRRRTTSSRSASTASRRRPSRARSRRGDEGARRRQADHHVRRAGTEPHCLIPYLSRRPPFGVAALQTVLGSPRDRERSERSRGCSTGDCRGRGGCAPTTRPRYGRRPRCAGTRCPDEP
jgi:hypothetical protein